jgi:predicted small secreted protein
MIAVLALLLLLLLLLPLLLAGCNGILEARL